DAAGVPLAAVARVLDTRAATRRILTAAIGHQAEIVAVALPGVEPPAAAVVARKSAGQTINLLAVGAVVPRKGYDILIEAVDQLADLDWQLVIAGDCKRDLATAGELATTIAHKRLEPLLCLAGATNEHQPAAPYPDPDPFTL